MGIGICYLSRGRVYVDNNTKRIVSSLVLSSARVPQMQAQDITGARLIDKVHDRTPPLQPIIKGQGGALPCPHRCPRDQRRREPV